MAKSLSKIFSSIRFAKKDPKHDKGHKGGSQDDEEHGAVDSQEFAQQVAHVKKRAMQESKMSAPVKLQKAMDLEKQKRLANERYKEELKKRGESIANKQKQSVAEGSDLGLNEMDKSQDPPGRDGGTQFPLGPKTSKKDIKSLKKDPVKHLNNLFAKEYDKKKQSVAEGSDVTNYNPKNQGGTRKQLLAKYHKTKNPKDAEAARRSGATQKELQGMAEGLRDPKDNPCWKGYEPIGTKMKKGRKVPNCVPVKESRKMEVVREALVKAKKKLKDAKETSETFQKEPIMSKEITKV